MVALLDAWLTLSWSSILQEKQKYMSNSQMQKTFLEKSELDCLTLHNFNQVIS